MFEVSPQSEVWTISKTICHWSVLGDTNTMVSLWNYSSQAQDLTLTLHYSGGQYVLPVHLNPRADTELDIASLIRNGVPDQNGSVIPQSITEGSAVLSDAKDRRNKIYVASSTSTFNVRNGTCVNECGTCDGAVSLALAPSAVIEAVSSSTQSTGEMTYNYGTVYTDAVSGNWSTSNSAIATVSTSGMVSGVGGGTANFMLAPPPPTPVYTGYICEGPSFECPSTTMSATASANVQAPSSVSIVTTNVNGPNKSCGSGTAGWYRQVTRQLVDQNGHPINTAGITLTETVTIDQTANGLGIGQVNTGSGNTNAQGQFQDIFDDCSAVCASGHNAATDATQTITATFGGHAYSVGNYALQYTCNAIYVNGS